MFSLIKQVLKSDAPGGKPDLTLEQQGELQSLRLELEEQRAAAARLAFELDQLRGESANLASGLAASQWERFLNEAAVPAAQILTQIHLLEDQGKPVPVRDVLAAVRRLLRLLEDQGLTWEGTPGQVLPFDPQRHQPLAQDVLEPGCQVAVRLAGASLHGKILRKAGVEVV